jgi:uncharacterized SAM-binding protein YcdF (DUF218 family)
MIYLRQILPQLVLPLGIALALLIFGVVRRRRWPILSAIALLWITSLPLVSEALMRVLEGPEGRQPAATAPMADAIVVLSIGRNISRGAVRVSEWTDADRFFGGVELFKAGRAPLLIFTGGWTIGDSNAPLEGDTLAGYAKDIGVPAERILTTTLVRTTEEEAAAVGKLVQERQLGKRILLVTSAFHMARATRLFSAAGFEVLPFAVDYSTQELDGIGVMDVVPRATALSQSERALREFYGRAYYWLLQ